MVALATGPKRSPFDSMARKRIAKSESFLRVPIPASRLPLARPPRRGRIARRYLGGAQRDQMNVCTDSPNFRTLLAPVHGPALSSSVHDIEGNGQVVARLHFRGKVNALRSPPPGGGDHKKMIPAGFPGAGALQICYNRS